MNILEFKLREDIANFKTRHPGKGFRDFLVYSLGKYANNTPGLDKETFEQTPGGIT